MDGIPLKDALVADAAQSQRDNGLLPTTRENEAFWQRVVERNDAKDATDPPPAAPTESPVLSRTANQIIEGEGRPAVQMRPAPSDPKRGKLNTRERVALALVRMRSRILMAYPEWADRVRAAIDAGIVYPRSAAGNYQLTNFGAAGIHLRIRCI